MRTIKRLSLLATLSALLTLGFGGISGAACTSGQQACSTSYGVGEVFFGSGGSLDTTCSTTYCAKQSVGELGVGNTKGTNYQAQAGFNVDRYPSLTFLVNTTNVNLGHLFTTSTAYATATFSVKAYLADGYVVETVGGPPANGSYTLNALTTPTASQTGQEQFGINLVSNSTGCTPPAPANFGANPVQVPSSSYSYGVAAHNSSSDYYDTCGEFMYKSGDNIASSSQSSGETDYTISYIANISSTTPAGIYVMNQSLVAIPTY